MTKKRNIGLSIFILSLAFVLFACSLGGNSDPKDVNTLPEPTLLPTETISVPAEPTETPIQPDIPKETSQAPADAESSEDSSEDSSMEAPTEDGTGVATPPANEIYVKAVNGYYDELEYLHIIGLVTNNTDLAVDSVEVAVDILDRDGNTIHTEIVTISLYTLAVGETSPFSYWVSEDVPGAESYKAVVVGQSIAEVERASLKVNGVLLSVDDNGDIHLTGKLINNTVSPIQIESLAAATFDENGEIYTADSHSVIVRHLDPGEDGPFRVTMTGHGDLSVDIEDFEIYIDAITANPIEIFDFTTSESHYYYIDSYDTLHLIGEVSNNNNEFFTISLIAGIYDSDGNVVDAATTDIPTFSIGPGETLPYDFQYWGPLNYKKGTIDTASNYYVQWDPYWTWTSTSEYVDITTKNNNNEVDPFQVTFTGDVVNNSGEAISGATVIVSLFDIESEQLVGMGYGGIYDPITSNGTAPYQIWIDTSADFDFSSVEYTIVAKGDLP